MRVRFDLQLVKWLFPHVRFLANFVLCSPTEGDPKAARLRDVLEKRSKRKYVVFDDMPWLKVSSLFRSCSFREYRLVF